MATAESNGVTRSVAILVGTSISGGGGGQAHSKTVPVTVWLCQERARQSMKDSWRHTLQHFHFLDDTARWTHLDQLLLRFDPQSLYLGCSDSLQSGSSKSPSSNPRAKAKASKIERMMHNLQVFLEERQAEKEDSERPGNNNAAKETTAFQLHTHVPVDSSKVEAAISQLLLQDAEVQLAYRGNVNISEGVMQRGLALWLQGEGLYPPSLPSDHWEHSLKIQAGVLNSHLVMDRTAASCIHLLPPANAGVATIVGGNHHNNSLFGLLSKPCCTSMGKAKLQVWLRQPLIDLEAIMHRQNAVTTLMTGVGKDCLAEALPAFSSIDLPNLASVLASYAPDEDDGNAVVDSNTRKPLKALYQLYLLSSTQLPKLLEAMEAIDVEESALLQDAREQVSRLLAELDRCEGLVHAVLDLEKAPRDFLVKPTFSAELQELYDEIANVQTQVDEELEEMQERWVQASGDTKTDVRLEHLVEDSSWQFRLPDTNSGKIIESMQSDGIKMHRVLKNGVYFTTKGLRQLSESYKQLSADYSQHSKQVVKDAMSVATTYQTVVERAADVISTLDVIAALAHVAAYSPHGYCKPTLTDSDDEGAGIELKAARHPCVELQEDMEFIPNDFDLKLGTSHNFLLVTGPNMGGKSTYIRSLGAIVCLAQIGSYVPADQATINICHSLLARVGAGDLQERGISTFMAEMLEASSILKTATKRSLIIIDELGRGTSTFDGYGLARAISEYLQRRIGCLTVFATHFHELTQLPGARNCHVTARKGSQGLTFLYEVRPGPCLESFGIQVAEMAAVPPSVIQDAKRKAEELEDFGHQKRPKSLKADSGNGLNLHRNRTLAETFAKVDLTSVIKASTSNEEKKRRLLELLGQSEGRCLQ